MHNVENKSVSTRIYITHFRTSKIKYVEFNFGPNRSTKLVLSEAHIHLPETSQDRFFTTLPLSRSTKGTC
jgi:hypothetical protein